MSSPSVSLQFACSKIVEAVAHSAICEDGGCDIRLDWCLSAIERAEENLAEAKALLKKQSEAA